MNNANRGDDMAESPDVVLSQILDIASVHRATCCIILVAICPENFAGSLPLPGFLFYLWLKQSASIESEIFYRMLSCKRLCHLHEPKSRKTIPDNPPNAGSTTENPTLAMRKRKDDSWCIHHQIFEYQFAIEREQPLCHSD